MTEKTLSLAKIGMAIVGTLATVFSCLIAFIVLANPTATQRIIIEFYNPTTPTPQVIVITQPVPALPTYTPYPTNTLPPTPLLTPTNSTVVLFQDNFNEGPKPDWELAFGNWIMSNGEFSITRIDEINPTNNRNEWSYGTALVGNPDWQDYKMKAQINLHDEAGNCGAVLVRAQDAKNFLAWEFCVYYQFVGAREETATWYIVQDGVGFEIPNSKTVNFPSDKIFTIEVIVKGDLIQSFIDKELVNTFSGFPYTKGKAGIRIQSNTISNTLSFDNFIVESISP